MHTNSYPQRISHPTIQLLDRLAEHSGTTAGFCVY
jgi:hypothetical protein